MAGLDPKVSFEPAVRKVFTGDETIVIKDGMMTRPKISVATNFFCGILVTTYQPIHNRQRSLKPAPNFGFFIDN
jgi:hypothetical protein